MHIYGPSQLHGPQSIGSPHNVRNTQPPARPEIDSRSTIRWKFPMPRDWSNRPAIFPTSGKIAWMRSANRSPPALTKPKPNSTWLSNDCWMKSGK